MLWCTVAAKDARWVRCSSWPLQQVRTRVHRQLAIYSVWVRRDATTAFCSRIMVVFVFQRIERDSHICVNLVLLLYEYQAQLSYYLVKDRCRFSI